MGQLQFSPICTGYNNYLEDGESDKFVLNSASIFSATVDGSQKNKSNSCDALLVYNVGPSSYFLAIFDGFDPYETGRNPSTSTSIFVKTYLDTNKEHLLSLRSDRDIQHFLKELFAQSEDQMRLRIDTYKNCGTCCLMAYIHKSKVHVANAGTSRAVLCRIAPNYSQPIHLSRDNKPSLPDEERRIMNAGGNVRKAPSKDLKNPGEPRVWVDSNGTSVSATRALGAFSFKKYGIISDPEIEHFDLVHLDKFIVMGSDGLWDIMETDDVIKFLHENGNNKEKAANYLVEEARRRWITSKQVSSSEMPDISAIVVYLAFEINEEKRLKNSPFQNSQYSWRAT